MAFGKTPKTYSEFEKFRQDLFDEEFVAGNLHPVDFGARRAKFQVERLEKLIEAAEGVNGSTVQKKIAGWKRQLERLKSTQARFEKHAVEIKKQDAKPPQRLDANRLDI